MAQTKTGFNSIRQKAVKEWNSLKFNKKPVIYIGTSGCGITAGALDVLDIFKKELKKRKLNYPIIQVGCIGLCYAEPIVMASSVNKPVICYGRITSENALKLLTNYIIKDKIAEEYVLGLIGEESIEGVQKLFEIPGLRSQVRRISGNCGLIDPQNISHYLANDGYSGLEKTVGVGGKKVITEIRDSGLRERDDEGLLTWRKWVDCLDSKASVRYLICNGGSENSGHVTRFLLESDPHSVLEGMLITGCVIGASVGFIYCSVNETLALERIKDALEQAEKNNLIGENILKSGFDFRIKIIEGNNNIINEDDTALISVMEGGKGLPRPKPPFITSQGLWGKPTIIHNAETFVNISRIMQNNAAWFSRYGTRQSKGTKLFFLTGDICREGLIEIPLGMTVKQVINDIGGGVNRPGHLKAVHIGGVIGKTLPPYLSDAGIVGGSEEISLLSETSCLVDHAGKFLEFGYKEFCGACTPCRLGTRQLFEILKEISEGRGNPGDISLLKELSLGIKDSSLCKLGQRIPDIILSGLEFFIDEYEEHVIRKRCRAGVCREIISSPCQHFCPIDSEPQNYIALIAEKNYKEALLNVLKDNPLPLTCSRLCHHPCELKCEAGKVSDPLAIRDLKQFVMDQAVKKNLYPISPKEKSDSSAAKGEKVAIIGSGPAGLTAAYFLAEKFYDVTVYEAAKNPGGIPGSIIPDFKLAAEIFQKDLIHITDAGVKIITQTRVGKDISFNKIVKENKSVFIAVGAHSAKKLQVENGEAKGVVDFLEFSKDLKAKKKSRFGKTVGIVGGGHGAVNSARAAVRIAGCEKVYLIFKGSQNGMTADAVDIEDGREEGIEFMFNTGIKQVIVNKDRIKGIQCIKMRSSLTERSGKIKSVPVEGTEFDLDLDMLINASGRCADLFFLKEQDELKITDNNEIIIDPETFQTGMEGVFAGGDAVEGAKTFIDAMAAGKKAAEMIDKYIVNKEETIRREYRITRPENYIIPGDSNKPETVTSPRTGGMNNFSDALSEAGRCLRCDLKTKDGEAALKQIKAEGLSKEN